ncbi:MAG TPA: Mrp/NBP35 family ATP-binding protein [Caulobacteraceae bacterium]|jgi:ATP-binding protein involved in chromosome partitioning|nr:Mrp/NBP35 family ATP-binding protein [Caulobacteraceae bacterium]
MADPSNPDRATVLAALDQVRDPRSGRGLAAAGLVQALVLGPDRAGFMIEVAAADAGLYAPVRDAAEAVLREVSGAEKIQVVLTASAGPPPRHAENERPPDPNVVRVRRGARLSPEAQAQMSPARPTAALKPANVRHVVAVSSAKGGVGKSTVALNLAAAMAMLGRRVGLLDADVYGPSIPRMSGLDGDPELNAERKLVPLQAWGLKIMSIGFLVDEGAPMIWRGPIASSALNQMLNDVAWASEDAPLDVLLIDMPPGTGDVQLTLAQRVSLSGAVVVSTPQEVALIDVRRGAAMFEKTHVPILGVVENMAYFPDPATGAPIPIFGRGGARATAEALGAPFLGEIPIEIALRQACDDGRPLVADGGDSAASKAFLAMAESVLDALDRSSLKPPPKIVFED